MNHYKALLILLCLFVGIANAQEKEVSSPDVSKLDATLRRMISFVGSVSSFEVDVDQSWKLEGAKSERRGGNSIRLQANHDGRFRLVVHPDGNVSQALTCSSDGDVLTRSMMRGEVQLYSMQPGDLAQLTEDGITESSLRHSGLDLIFREDPLRYLMGMSSDVEFLGRETLAEHESEHYRVNWIGSGRQTHEFWIAEGRSPLLLKLKSTIKFEVAEGQPQTMTIVSDLKWNLHEVIEEDEFKQTIGESAVKVLDLYGYLSEGGTLELVGQDAPVMKLPTLGNDAWDISKHRSKGPVGLYFYASWAAPCRVEIPELMQFIQSYEKRGVAFYAIDVGEDAKTTAEFVKTQGYSGDVVVDADSEASVAYRITALPTVVLIDSQGKITSAHTGNTPEVREMVAEELDELLENQVEK